MNTTTQVLAGMRYVRDVAEQLEDLPDDERAELLEEVEQHVAELVAEAGGEDALELRLGTAAAFAAELRAAAGLPPRAEREIDPAVRRLAARLSATAPARAARRAHDAVSGTAAYASVRAFLPELRPGWWVLRGYLAVLLLAVVPGDGGESDFPLPRVGGSAIAGVLLLAGAVWLSVAWGRRTLAVPRARTLTVLANAGLVLVAWLVAADHAHTRIHYVGGADGGYHEVLSGPYGPVTNIHPYGADGRPLDGVTLYDQDGRPLDYLLVVTERRLWTSVSGEPVPHAYPQRYVERVWTPGAGESPSPHPRPALRAPVLAGTPSPDPSPAVSPTPAPSPRPTR